MAKEIALSGKHGAGKVAVVDDEDYEWLSQWRWHCTNVGYAARSVREGAKQTMLLIHRLIIDAPAGFYVDHINVDRLDNRRSNLRLCTNSENQMNCRKQSGRSSRFKGVVWNKQSSKWRAQIMVNRRSIFAGYYGVEEDAARAYNEAAKKYFGEFARLNEINEAEA